MGLAKRYARKMPLHWSLVPKDAALIFERLETETLLDVAARMKEQKVAAIMAKMSPDSAQDLTVRLIKRRDMPEFGAFTGVDKKDGTKG